MIRRLTPPLLRTCLLVIAVLTAACAAPPPVPPPDYPETLTTRDAVLVIQRRARDLRAVHAELRIRSEEGTLRGYLWAAVDGRLRIQARKFFWTAFDLSIDGDALTLHRPRESRALQAAIPELGPRGGALIVTRDLLRALMGPAGSRIAVFDEAAGTLVLSGGAPGGRREVWVYDRKHLLLRRIEMYSPDADLEVEVALRNYRLFGERWWPGSAVLETPEEEMEIELTTMEANPTLDPDVFRIDLPEGTVIVDRFEDLDE